MKTIMTTRSSRTSMIFRFMAVSLKGARAPSKWSQPYVADRLISASRSSFLGTIHPLA